MASAVTYEMVEDVCNHLAAGGERPTYLKVHQQLGKGSTRIVSDYIRQWREAHALGKALERDPLFGEWPEALQLKARSLFDALLALSAEAASASETRLKFQSTNDWSSSRTVAYQRLICRASVLLSARSAMVAFDPGRIIRSASAGRGWPGLTMRSVTPGS